MITKKQLDIIGATEYIDIDTCKRIPAKIDTGADSSSVWASHIEVNQEGVLSFCLFDEKSPFYTGKTIKRTDYKVAIVRDASGKEQIRYRTHLNIAIAGRNIRAFFYLANRSKNSFPILIGRRTIKGKFYVDVSQKHTDVPPPKNPKVKHIRYYLKKDPYQFHLKYMEELSADPNNIKQEGVI